MSRPRFINGYFRSLRSRFFGPQFRPTAGGLISVESCSSVRSVPGFLNHVGDVVERHLPDKLSMLDSAGYSGKKGTRDKKYLEKMYEARRSMIEGDARQLFQRIASVDISALPRNPELNNPRELIRLNRHELSLDREIIQSQSDLAERMMWVWQLGEPWQLEAWLGLAKEFRLDQNYRYQSAPWVSFPANIFIPLHFHEQYRPGTPFQFHLLGVSQHAQRFLAFLMEEVCNRCLERDDSYISYDTTGFFKSAVCARTKKLPCKPDRIYTDAEQREIMGECYPRWDLNRSLIAQKSFDPKCRRLDADAEVAFHIHDEVEVDAYFLHKIRDVDLFDEVFNNGEYPSIQVMPCLRDVRKKYSKLDTKFEYPVMTGVDHIKKWIDWWQKNRPIGDIEKLVF
ncbi:MAG: hypothetical protein HQL69_16655 [Magnetococcales bacterium]|nr:hypothetical protein [Magnetococcales bacterium]